MVRGVGWWLAVVGSDGWWWWWWDRELQRPSARRVVGLKPLVAIFGFYTKNAAEWWGREPQRPSGRRVMDLKPLVAIFGLYGPQFSKHRFRETISIAFSIVDFSPSGLYQSPLGRLVSFQKR